MILDVEAGENPLPRSGHRLMADDGNIYAIGGYIQFPDRLVVKGEIWRYNIVSNRWDMLHFNNLSFHLAASHTVCALRHTAIVHGGTGTNFGKFIDNSLSVLDFRSLTSCTLSSAPKDNIQRNVPLPTYGHTLSYAIVDGEPFLYKVGGAMGATYTMNVYRYSLHLKIWERIYHNGDPTNLHPENRYRHDTVLYKDKLYVIAGGNEIETHPLWPMPVFDLSTNKWSFIRFAGSVPPLFRYQSSALIDHDVYIVGGIRDGPGAINPEIYRLDLEERTCQVVGRQESPAYFHDVVYIPHLDELYSFGGTNRTNPVTRTNELHRFRLHRRPLALLELAWNRLLILLRSPSLALFSIEHYVTSTVPSPSRNAFSVICDRLHWVHCQLTDKLPFFPCQLCDLSVPAAQPHVVVFRVSAIVLLIACGFRLGLHSVKPVQTHSDVISAIQQVISGGRMRLSMVIKQLSQRLHVTNVTKSVEHPHSTDHNPSCMTSEVKSHTQLPIATGLDKLFYTLFLFLLNVPERLIRRLPDGSEYLRYVMAIQRLLGESVSVESMSS